ncbi:MAG TPA: N-acetyl-gamma-glutamyl-phosphate reductase [Desulfobacterales bacterium]|nr:N-acetyl-gamma-glutamyl-phosphate reductase [Desulfobacterales bacterium]HIP38150.1 N-acetyl-gamma-glutamyl-phosphate reductase [Desulfocapsa sulfexigens]
MKYKIFVDGQFGTTGLKIDEMLNGRDELQVLKIAEKDKKRPEIKQELLDQADLVFLCLPDAASVETMQYITDHKTKVIDASTAHRTNSDWTYGIPELNPQQREKIRNSSRVCVPGCHATGFVMALNPLIEKGIVVREQKLVCHSITGYSGGGKAMIESYENPANFNTINSQRPYALTLNHKHLPEMQYVLGLKTAPLFTPSVGNFKQGMLVMSYLIKDQLTADVSGRDIIELYREYYENNTFVKIIEDTVEYLDNGFLDATSCNNTNRIEISVHENRDYLVVISRLDNLGKGASGAAVQNMNIMLGLDEEMGLKS